MTDLKPDALPVVAWLTTAYRKDDPVPHQALNYTDANAKNQHAHWIDRGCEVKTIGLVDGAELSEVQAERDTLQAELAAMREQKPVAWMWEMHGWLVTAHGKHRAIKRHVDTSRPPESTMASDDFIRLTPLYAPSQVAAEVVQEAARCVFVMRHIASMGDDEFDGDTVDLRFEDDQGRDTGCDVSISEYAGKAADVIEALLATSQGEA